MWKDILKKNALSIACGVVALIAIILIFVPADGWVTELQSKLDARKSVNSTLAGLSSKQRTLPVIEPGADAAQPLPLFPSETVIARGKQATEEVKKVSQTLFKTAVDLNQKPHPLLVNNTLPRSGEVPKLQFRGAYMAAFKFAPDRQTPQLPDFNIPVSILQGTQPPTQEQIAYEQARLWDEEHVKRIVLVGGQPANAQQVSSDYLAAAVKVPEALRLRAATQKKIYVLPGALQVNPAIQGTGMPPREEDIWSSQLSYWIQADIARAIAAINAPSQQGILDAPVKQLVQLIVGGGPGSVGSAAAAGAGGAGPAAAGFGGMGPMGGGYGGGYGGMDDGSGAAAASGAKVSDPAELLVFDYVTGPTGRKASGLYDVYDFQLTVDVEAAKLNAFINELTRDRYVSVRWLNFTPVNLNEMKKNGFLYGDAPVVRVVMYGEMLFLRSWTEKFMPDSIKTALGIAPPPVTTPEM